MKYQRSSQSKAIAELPTPERIRIAQELHDGIAQDLVGLGYSLDLLMAQEELTQPIRADIRRTRFEVDSLIAKVRSEILNLREGSHAPLSSLLKNLAASIVTREKVHFDFQIDKASHDESREILAIAGEILRNCVSHARASRIDIRLYPINNLICLEIVDDGIGGAHVKSQRYGLLGIQERVKQIQGTIHIDSPAMKGTRIAIAI